jgi:hypothetical protein
LHSALHFLTSSRGQRQTHWPDFEINLVDLARLEGLALVAAPPKAKNFRRPM